VRKEALFGELRERYRKLVAGWSGYRGYAGWMAGGLNNAKLNALDAYARWVPAMECVLEGAGGLEGFYGVMDRLGEASRAERRLHLDWFVRRVAGLRAGEGGVVQVSRSISATP
jgi:predicted aminopeptidase